MTKAKIEQKYFDQLPILHFEIIFYVIYFEISKLLFRQQQFHEE